MTKQEFSNVIKKLSFNDERALDLEIDYLYSTVTKPAKKTFKKGYTVKDLKTKRGYYEQ